MQLNFKTEFEAIQEIKTVLKDQYYRFYYNSLKDYYTIDLKDYGCTLSHHNLISIGSLLNNYSKIY